MHQPPHEHDATPPARGYLLGDSAVVIETFGPARFTVQQRIWQLARDMARHPAVLEVIPGMNNLTLTLQPDGANPEDMVTLLVQQWQALKPGEQIVATRTVEIPVTYGGVEGPDLDTVARHCGLTIGQVVEQHASGEYQVYFLGFQPGFAYLGGLDPSLATPRRAEPRLSVPAGSVGIGGEQTGIYSSTTPSGWHIIGRTTLTLFDAKRPSPATLQPGDRVRFIPVSTPPHA